jgi:CspA family cold shock protein
MQTGKVKFFNSGKGYGFITDDHGKDIFVHVNGIKTGTRISEGDTVKFDTEQGKKGTIAVNVSKY